MHQISHDLIKGFLNIYISKNNISNIGKFKYFILHTNLQIILTYILEEN